MEEKRLPRNEKEGLLYGAIIAGITATIMLLVNVGEEIGLKVELIWAVLKTLPLMMVIAMALETFVVGRIAGKLVVKFTEPSDGFNARILFNILFCVTGMSVIMTILGGFIGTGFKSLDPLTSFPARWPRNFAIVLWCEILLAQPAARKVMKMIHTRQEKKQPEEKELEGGVCSEQR